MAANSNTFGNQFNMGNGWGNNWGSGFTGIGGMAKKHLRVTAQWQVSIPPAQKTAKRIANLHRNKTNPQN